VKRAPIPALGLALGLFLATACATDRVGWGRRGRFWKLDETPALQVRRGPQILDPKSGELAITWLGVRSPDGQPPLLACELTVFDDRNQNGTPEADEVVCVRESSERTAKILFDDVRVRGSAGARLLARLVVRTEDQVRNVTWSVAPD
jgi:hypothetical protein